nr:hypothetical protein [Tanacetum cinerariifolium]
DSDEEDDDEDDFKDDDDNDDEEEDEVTKGLYDDVNVNLGNEDIEMTNADQGTSEQQNASQQSGFEQEKEDAHVTLTHVLDTQKTRSLTQSSYVSSDFTSKLSNLDNPSLADNEIAYLIDTTAYHATTILEITLSFTTPTPPPPLFFNPLSQQATPTLTSTASKITTSLPVLPDFESVFKFNERVTNLEKDLIEIKQVDQEEAQAEKREYIKLLDSTVRTIIKEKVNTQLPYILPQAISDVATLAAALIFGFELTNILIDKMEKNKSFDIADYKKEPYDALVKFCNTDKGIFDSYGEVFSLKRSRDDKDKDQDPTAGSDRGTKIKKSSKDAKSSRDSRSKEKKSSSASKEPPNLNKSLRASLPMLRSQIILLKTYACNKIKSLSRETMINNPLTRRRYSTSVTKTNTTYELKWIKDLVPKLWSPVQVKYDQHVYLATSHWGPKYQIFYGYARNMTCLKIFAPEEELLRTKRLMRADELYKFSDGTLNDVRSALHEFAAGIRMEYLPMRKWINLDKKRARVMDKQLYQRRLVRNLEKFVGGRNQRDLPRDNPLNSVEVLRFLGGTAVVEVILVKGHVFPFRVKVWPVGKFLDDLCDYAFSGTNGEDAVEYIEYFLKILDLINLSNVKYERLRLFVFSILIVGITSITVNGKRAYELKGKFLDDLCDNAFSGTNGEDAVEYIEYFLKNLDLINLSNVKYERLRLFVFSILIVGNASKWSNKEFSDVKKANNDDEQETTEIFRIETNLFEYETSLCTEFKEFNFLLKVDPQLFTHDIKITKTYEDYKNKLNDELEEPWSKDGVPYEICDHICKPFHFKIGKAKWPFFNSNEDGF